jgi:large subunit ribosomal protein L15
MANELSKLHPQPGERKTRMRIGRGEGSGKGKTAGKGTKGAQARAGYKNRPGFEGGQMPLHRRLPKKGFHNLFRKDHVIVNVGQLAGLPAGTRVDQAFLHEQGIISRIPTDGVKLLGVGEISVALEIHVAKASGSASEKVTAAGGRVVTAASAE